MKTVVIHGKVTKPVSPKIEFPDAELWGCTHTQQQYAKHHARLDDWDAWWDLHPVEKTDFYPGIRHNRPGALAWYRTLPANDRPLWMLQAYPDIPASVAFPHERVRAAFPIFDDPKQTKPGGMFSCQVDFMIAYAILEGYEHIVLHGHGVNDSDPVHMAAHRGILYWVGYARGKGIKMTVLAPSWYRAPVKAYAIEAGGWKPRLVAQRGRR